VAGPASPRQVELAGSRQWNCDGPISYSFCATRLLAGLAKTLRKAFNLIMRIVSTIVGLLMVAMGAVWTLQGLNIAFRFGFMVGDYHWTIYGAILALAGVALIIWTNLRRTES